MPGHSSSTCCSISGFPSSTPRSTTSPPANTGLCI
uniref:Uncharacterized protein n=1 Tax=Anguilla anguilla TaxID=7936 RepID=A0A0E9VQ73_ANGAN